ncbi:MAG: copper chaperone PCu(A)C [Sphingobium sp.]|jgi:copper(I)-binding protein|nr:copper chaperone PCu(A)C [Sphingobium sp.]MCI1271153.1 copper chaperone PCu(A)C [Sphingobium sp.]MCI2053017.1 copper chaperone PCu(A)C [Sphingobium sp.]
MRLIRLAALAAPLALAACADPAPLYVDQAWVQLNANPDAPSAGYFTIHGGPETVTLRSIQTEGAIKIEMHDSVMKDGMMTMAPIDSVAVPAKTKVAFAPGGKHLMLFSINPAVVKSGKLGLMFIFSNGDRLPVDATIKAAGGTNGGDHDMGHMNSADHAN